MKRAAIALCILASILGLAWRPALADQAQPYCQLRSGLDPACAFTALGMSTTDTPLTTIATEHTTSVFLQVAPDAHDQFSLSLPVYDHLAIAGIGDAYGTGDAVLGYSHIFRRAGRLAQVLGLNVGVPTGSIAFSSGRTQIAPLYALSYSVGNRIHLVLQGQYQWDSAGTKLPFAPRTQTFEATPRAVLDLSQRRGIYFGLEASQASVTGDYAYHTDDATATLGIIKYGLNVSASYTEPLGTFTYSNVHHHRATLQVVCNIGSRKHLCN